MQISYILTLTPRTRCESERNCVTLTVDKQWCGDVLDIHWVFPRWDMSWMVLETRLRLALTAYNQRRRLTNA